MLFENNSVVVSTIIVIINLAEVLVLALICRIHHQAQFLLGVMSPPYVPSDPYTTLILGILFLVFFALQFFNFQLSLEYDLPDLLIFSELYHVVFHEIAAVMALVIHGFFEVFDLIRF